MSTPQPQPHIGAAAIAPIGPSLTVKLVVAPMSRILNPLVAKLAGRRHFPMAQIHHVGRRSGKPYVTPVGAHVNDPFVLVPLTFGNRSDWVRNVRAAGQCWVRLNGQSYHAVRPQLLTTADAQPLVRAMFSPVERLAFRFLGIKQFIRLRLSNDGAPHRIV